MRDFNILIGLYIIVILVSWGMVLRNIVFWMLFFKMFFKTFFCGYRDLKLVYRNLGENWLRYKLGY